MFDCYVQVVNYFFGLGSNPTETDVSASCYYFVISCCYALFRIPL